MPCAPLHHRYVGHRRMACVPEESESPSKALSNFFLPSCSDCDHSREAATVMRSTESRVCRRDLPNRDPDQGFNAILRRHRRYPPSLFRRSVGIGYTGPNLTSLLAHGFRHTHHLVFHIHYHHTSIIQAASLRFGLYLRPQTNFKHPTQTRPSTTSSTPQLIPQNGGGLYQFQVEHHPNVSEGKCSAR